MDDNRFILPICFIGVLAQAGMFCIGTELVLDSFGETVGAFANVLFANVPEIIFLVILARTKEFDMIIPTLVGSVASNNVLLLSIVTIVVLLRAAGAGIYIQRWIWMVVRSIRHGIRKVTGKGGQRSLVEDTPRIDEVAGSNLHTFPVSSPSKSPRASSHEAVQDDQTSTRGDPGLAVIISGTAIAIYVSLQLFMAGVLVALSAAPSYVLRNVVAGALMLVWIAFAAARFRWKRVTRWTTLAGKPDLDAETDNTEADPPTSIASPEPGIFWLHRVTSWLVKLSGFAVLCTATSAAYFVQDTLVSAIQTSSMSKNGACWLFGLVGNGAEHISAIFLACRGHEKVPLQIPIESSLNLIGLVMPLSYLIAAPRALTFWFWKDVFNTVALLVSTIFLGCLCMSQANLKLTVTVLAFGVMGFLAALVGALVLLK